MSISINRLSSTYSLVQSKSPDCFTRAICCACLLAIPYSLIITGLCSTNSARSRFEDFLDRDIYLHPRNPYGSVKI